MKHILTVALFTLFSCAAAAHDPVKGAHGGMVVDAGAYHVELIAQNGDVELFVSDGANKPISSAGFKAVAILLADGKSHRIELSPAGGNKLSGKTSVALPKAPKGAVQLIQPDGKTSPARFN